MKKANFKSVQEMRNAPGYATAAPGEYLGTVESPEDSQPVAVFKWFGSRPGFTIPPPPDGFDRD